MDAITPPFRKILLSLKGYQNKVVIFVFLHFKFCPAIKKYYNVAIFIKTSTGAA